MSYCPFTEDLFLPFFALRRIKYLEVKLQQEFTIHNSAITQICTGWCCCIRILPADLCNALRTLSVMHRARPDKGAGAQCTMHNAHGAAARCIRTGSALSALRLPLPAKPACYVKCTPRRRLYAPKVLTNPFLLYPDLPPLLS